MMFQAVTRLVRNVASFVLFFAIGNFAAPRGHSADPPTADEFLALLDSRSWGAQFNRFEYEGSYPQNLERVKSRFTLEDHGEYQRYRIERVGKDSRPYEELIIRNPDYAFRLGRQAPDSPWVMSSFETSSPNKGSSSKRNRLTKLLEKELRMVRNLPTNIHIENSASDLLPLYDLTVSATADGSPLLRVTGTRKPQEEIPENEWTPFASLYARFGGLYDSSQNLFTNYEWFSSVDSSADALVTGSHVLAVANDGSPTPQLECYEVHRGNGTRKGAEYELVVLQAEEIGSWDKDGFRLSDYGFPEPSVPGERGSVLLLSAVGSVVIALVVFGWFLTRDRISP